MYIGGISKLTGASPKAIRHYESLGLLGDIHRTGCYRVYSDGEVAQIKLIRQAQALGFRLAELRPYLRDAAQPDWPGLARQIEHKRADVQAEARRLRALDAELQQIHAEILSCVAGAGQETCAAAAIAA